MAYALLLALLLTAQASAAQTWDAPTDIAAGNGEQGPWRQNDSRYDYVDDAAVAFAPDGGQYVAWADQAGRDVWLRRVGDSTLHAPVNVSRSPATLSWLPRIAVDAGRGRLYLLWQEIIFAGGAHGGDILSAWSTDGGKTFSRPRNLSHSKGGDGKGRLDRDTWSNGSLDLAVGADGSVFAAWTEYDGALWLSHSRDGGVRFSAPRRIAGAARRPARAPALAVGAGGTVYLAWSVGEDPRAALRLAGSLDNGASFGAPRLIGGGQGRADAPRLAFDGAGALHLVYAWHARAPARSEVRYTSAPDFAAPLTLSAPARNGDAAYPYLASDSRAGLVVVWENIGAGKRPRSLGIAVSRDAGRSFTQPAEVPASVAPAGASNGSQQGLLGQKLALDGAGRIAIVNSSLAPGRGSRVWLMRGRLSASEIPDPGLAAPVRRVKNSAGSTVAASIGSHTGRCMKKSGLTVRVRRGAGVVSAPDGGIGPGELIGGEPLLWRSLFALSRLFKETHGIAVSATTNGATLHRPDVRREVLAIFSELTISRLLAWSIR